LTGTTDDWTLHSIVAIHGLDGHREKSWTANNGVLWLRDLLPDEITPARILTYGYNAKTRGKKLLSRQTLYDHAEAFITKLVLFRRTTSVCDVLVLLLMSVYHGTAPDREEANYICGP
jgi:hypothetical protein